MYCGDETGAFVGEVASHSCRFGYGGDDCPKSVFPSYMFHDGTVPTTTHRFPPQKTSDTRMPMDGDGDGRTEEAVVPELEDVVPIYDRTPYGDGDGDGGPGGECDPDRFLANDGVVQNWDAWENAWAKSFDDLAVRRYGKHTRGKVSVETSRRKDRRSGAAGKRSRGDSDGDNKKGVTFRSVVGSDRSEERNLMHPLLSIYSDYTHYHLFQSTSNSLSTGPNYQKFLQRQKNTIAEILFKSPCTPNTFFAPAPMLVSFASGYQNSLVVDIGAQGCRVTLVVDCLLLENA